MWVFFPGFFVNYYFCGAGLDVFCGSFSRPKGGVTGLGMSPVLGKRISLLSRIEAPGLAYKV